MNRILPLLAIFATFKTVTCTKELLDAVLKRRPEEAMRILKGNPSLQEINMKDGNKFSSLTHALIRSEMEDVAVALIKQGADLRYGLPGNWLTPLHLAIIDRKLRAVRAMLRRKDSLDLEAREEYGCTPLLLAVKNAYHNNFPFLKLNEDFDETPDENMRIIIRELLDAGVNVEADVDTARAIHLTAINLDAWTANILLLRGANVNVYYVGNGDVTYTPLDLLLRGEGDESKRKDCMIAYVNYGAEMSPFRAYRIMKRFSPESLKIAREKSFRTLDECVIELTREFTKVRENKLRDLAFAYENQAAFALFRLLKLIKISHYAHCGLSNLEKRQLQIYEHMKSVMGRILWTKWEMLRISYNLSLASFSLGSNMDYVNKIATELVILKPISNSSFHYSLNW